MSHVFILATKFVMKDVLAQKGVTAKYIVNAIKFYVNLHIMAAIVLKGIVPQIIVHAI